MLLLASCSDSGSSNSGEVAVNPTSPGETLPRAKQPNVLLIMADDLGFNDLAINNGNKDIDTPNLDQLAREGMRFTRHYATAVCSPARAALLTGQYPERHGYLPDGRGISPDVVTLPESLQAAGYRTWHIGKWHIGDQHRLAWPDHQGFDHWFGFLNQWRLAGRFENGEIKLVKPRYNNPWLQGDREPGRHFEGHLETILTDTAVDAISELNAGEKPWFVNLWYYAPHTPLEPAAEFASRYPDTPQGVYRAHVNQLDHDIGRLRAHLESIGAYDNTIIIVVSDNGGTNNELDNNAPFAGRKGSLREGGLRTPMLIRWLDQDLNGKVFTETVTIRDIYPTLMEALHLAVPDGVDGASFLRSAKGLQKQPQRALFWEHAVGYGVLSSDGHWRLYTPPALYDINLPTELYNLELDSTGSEPVEPIPPARLAQLNELHRPWHLDVHQVKVRFTKQVDGTALVTGMDFMRTPGHGGYTFGIGIAAQSHGQLVSQEGIWSLQRTDNTVTASFGDVALSGTLDPDVECNSLAVSGLFYRKVSASSGDDHIALNLYINGRLQQTITSPGKLAVEDPTLPTVIGDASIAGPPSQVFVPQFLNISLETSPIITPETFSLGLCQG